MAAQDELLTFEQVYLRFIQPVYVAAYGILKNHADAEDVAHEVFLDYFRMKEKKQVNNTKNYLLKMARNKAVDLAKKRKEFPSDYVSLGVNTFSTKQPNREPVISPAEEAIARLPEDERQIVLLHVNAGVGFVQISKAMEMSVSAVYRRYRRAIKALQKTLKGGEKDE